MLSIYTNYLNSPIGLIEIKCNDKGVYSIQFCEKDVQKHPASNHIFIDNCIRQLQEYFDKRRKEFSFKIDFSGTPFQQKVWTHLLDIPYGHSVSYQDIARKVGNVKTIRAVGNANSRNKLPIVIPCHRVIGSDGTLTGYAGGLKRKEWLLKHEGHPTFSKVQLSLF